MKKLRGAFSEELLQQIKEYYLSNDVTLNEIAENSVNLFGQKITLDDLKAYSRTDKDGAWSILKANSGRKTSEVPVSEKLSKIADKLYDLMIDEEAPLSAGALVQVAKSWSELLVKANLNKEVSAKTSTQTVKDIFAKLEAERNNGTNN